MRHSDTSRPTRAFTAPSREVAVEILVTFSPEPAVPPGRLEDLLFEVMDRADRALAGAFDGLPGGARVDVCASGPHDVPVFPVNIGGCTYEVSTDVYEAVSRLRRGTPLEGTVYDSAGRAFECSVWCYFRRVPEKDRPVSEVWSLERPDPDGGSRAPS